MKNYFFKHTKTNIQAYKHINIQKYPLNFLYMHVLTDPEDEITIKESYFFLLTSEAIYIALEFILLYWKLYK